MSAVTSSLPPGTFAGKRLVFVLPWSELAGAERQALYFAEHLLSLGAAVEVACLTHHDGRAIEAFRSVGVPWRAARVDWWGSRTRKMRELVGLTGALRSMRPDALLPYCTPANVLCGLVWQWTGATTCVWHQQDALSSRFGDRIVRAALRRTPLVTAISSIALEWVLDSGARRDRARVISPFVRPRVAIEDRARWRSRLEIGADVPVVVMLASLGPNKDHATLLRAWRHVLDSTPGGNAPILLLAGQSHRGGEEFAKALAYDLELGRSVRFLGYVEDVGGLLEASDLAVLSSRSEGLGNAIVEPMALGMPVVVTDIPGAREAVGDGVALFAPVGDYVSLGKALVQGLADESLRADARRRNPGSVSDRFGPWTLDLHARAIAEAMGLAVEPSGAGTVTSTS